MSLKLSELIEFRKITFEHVYKDVPAEPETGITAEKDTVALKVGDVNLLPVLEDYAPELVRQIIENGKKI